MITFEIIGKRIRARREELNLSQQDLANLLAEKNINMLRETISKIESGNRATNAIEIKGICESLKISSEDIMRDELEEDLVSLFRSHSSFSDETIKEIEMLQIYIKSLVAQKKIDEGQIKLRKFKPSWEML